MDLPAHIPKIINVTKPHSTINAPLLLIPLHMLNLSKTASRPTFGSVYLGSFIG